MTVPGMGALGEEQGGRRGLYLNVNCFGSIKGKVEAVSVPVSQNRGLGLRYRSGC